MLVEERVVEGERVVLVGGKVLAMVVEKVVLVKGERVVLV